MRKAGALLAGKVREIPRDIDEALEWAKGAANREISHRL